jgi:hypothetical protein
MSDFYCCETVAGLLMLVALSDERTGVLFAITAGPRHHSHCRVRVPQDSQLNLTLSDSGLTQPGGPDPFIFITQEQGTSVMPPGTGFPFQIRLHRLA